MTPDARVLQFPTSAAARPQDYGQFSRELSADGLAGCFCFRDDDQRQIARRRGDVSRPGFAVQLGTVRYLGRFLENPAVAPAQVVAWTAREIGIAASSDLAGYGEGEWRWAHQAEIRRTYNYRPFGTPRIEPELVEWLRSTRLGDNGEQPVAVRPRQRVPDEPAGSAARVEHAVAARRLRARKR